jgi:hypothetical protein
MQGALGLPGLAGVVAWHALAAERLAGHEDHDDKQ